MKPAWLIPFSDSPSRRAHACASTGNAARAAACLLLALCMLSGCTGQKSSSTSSPGAAEPSKQDLADQQALESIGKRPWYDAEQHAYKPPATTADPDDPIRRSGWIGAPAPAAPAGGGGGRTGAGAVAGEALSYLVWIFLGAALIGLMFFLAYSSLGKWHRSKNPSAPQAIEIDPSRVVDLPFEAQAEMHDPLAYARMLMERGDHDSAVLFVYAYMLLALDRAGMIVLHRGKTNRMYLFELNGQRTLRDLLSPAMLAFEDQFFGRHSITRERCLRIWEQLDGFHRELAPAIAATASAQEVVVQ